MIGVALYLLVGLVVAAVEVSYFSRETAGVGRFLLATVAWPAYLVLGVVALLFIAFWVWYTETHGG